MVNEKREAIKRVWPVIYAALLLGAIGWLNFISGDDQQYRRLAESLLQGKLSLSVTPLKGWADTAQFEGRYYLAFGPLPALLNIPLIWTDHLSQGELSFVATLVVFYLCYRLARGLNYSYDESCWLALAFCFATSFTGVAALACSTFFAHVLAVMFLFLAINEYEGRSRAWLIGGLIGLAMASRPPAGLNILLFVLVTFFSAGTIRERMAGLAKLLLPFSAIVGLLALYNFARFGNPLESGYTYQLNGFGTLYSDWSVPGNQSGPPFSFNYVADHLWIFLFGLPSTDAVGTSVLLISPFLGFLWLARRWDLTNNLIVIDVTVVLLAVLAFRSTGFEQMGYRFSLDFLPFVFWLLMRSGVEVTKPFKGLILLSTILDVCLTVFFLASGVDRRQ